MERRENIMKRVYICHQYYEKAHFKALYDCARDYGYQVMDLIVLNPASAVKHRQKLIEKEGQKAADKWYQNNFINQGKLWLLRDEIVIIALAPYDRLLAQYQGVLAQNHSILITSWKDWNSGDVPYPFPENRKGYMETLTNYIDGVACVSRKAEEEISPYNKVTQVVNHAIETSKYAKKKDFKRRKKYIFMGHLIELKNIKVIVEYLENHPEKKITIDIAGDGDLKDALEQFAAHDMRLHLLGHISKDAIMTHLHEYDYLILPSKRELFGIVLLEALACGVPCIVSNASGPAEIIQHNRTGIIFRLEEKDDFEKAMNYSMELGDDKYEEMSNNAIAESKQYDVNEIIKKWIMLFEKVSK